MLIWTVFEREYLNIVTRKAFWLTTLLLPIGMALIFGIQIVSMLWTEKSATTVWVVEDALSPIRPTLVSGEGITYQFTEKNIDSIKKIVENSQHDVLIMLPDTALLQRKQISFPLYHGGNNVNEQVKHEIEKRIKSAIHAYKRDKMGISQAQLDALDFKLEASTQKITQSGTQQTSGTIAYMLGFVMNLLMYMLVVIYGSMLMQSVIEEKNNRIVEIIISSISPFKLLLGKILAVALAGLTQFLLWVVLSGVVLFAATLVMGITISPEDLINSQPKMNMPAGVDTEMGGDFARELIIGIRNFNWNILWLFPIYFIGGFFLMGSLYAALGAATDNIQDAQQFSTPLTLMSVLPMLFVTNILTNPNSGFAIFASMFPFFSPMVMMSRMALTEVPTYQILLSIFILIASFLGTVWVAGKIYRVGILMYGKKPSVKEMLKWVWQ